jgi:hypothetical protein
MNLVIDSSTLLQDPSRTRAATKALERLIAHGEVKLFIPAVVEQEVLAHLRQTAANALSDLLRPLKSLERHVPPNFQKRERDDLVTAVAELGRQLANGLADEFSGWLGMLGAEILDIRSHHGKIVMKEYFSGEPPYSEPRSRKDIPDSYILQAVRDLVLRVQEVGMVVSDTQLRDSIAPLINGQVYESLDSFIRSPIAQDGLRRARGASNMAAILEFLSTGMRDIGTVLNAVHVDRLAGQWMSGRNVPSPDSEARITVVDDTMNLGIEWKNAEYYGDGKIAVPSVYHVAVSAECDVYISDYYAMSEQQLEGFSVTTLNEHFVSVEGNYQIQAKALLIFDVGVEIADHDATIAELREWAARSSVTIDSYSELIAIDDLD